MDDMDISRQVDKVVDTIEDKIDIEVFADEVGLPLSAFVERVANELKARNAPEND